MVTYNFVTAVPGIRQHLASSIRYASGTLTSRHAGKISTYTYWLKVFLKWIYNTIKASQIILTANIIPN